MADIVSLPGAASPPADRDAVRAAFLAALGEALEQGAVLGLIVYEDALGRTGIAETAGVSANHSIGILDTAMRRAREEDGE